MNSKNVTLYYAGFLRYGGVLTHLKSLELELHRIGYNVTTITLDKLPFPFKYLPHLIEKIVNIYNRPLGYFYKDKLTGFLYKKFFDFNVDFRIFEDIYIGWNSDIPSISILHAVWSDNLQSYKLSQSQKQKLIDREINIINKIKHPIVTVSEPYLYYLTQFHFNNKISNCIKVIELGINQNKILSNKNKYNKNIKSIVYTGTLEARKNVLFLIKVFKKIKLIDSEFNLTIVGDGPDRIMLEKFSNDNNLRINFLGSLTHDKVLLELQNHSIYVHTSIKESFSYSLLEAKLAGLKTCAYSKLQVPEEFIDVSLNSFDLDDWCKNIINIDLTPVFFNKEKYTINRMTFLTINSAK